MRGLEWFIASRYLRGKRKRGPISLISYISSGGVFLGSLALVIALSVANGFEAEVRSRIIGVFAHARITQYFGNPIQNPEALMAEVLRHPAVTAAAPFISGKAAIEYEGAQEGILVTGIDDSLESRVTDIARKMKSGRFGVDTSSSERSRRNPGILLGSGLADRLGVRPGVEVVLGSLVRAEGSSDPVQKMGRYTVNGVFETGMYEYDLNLAYISIPAAQDLFGMRGVEGIQIRTVDMYKADRIARDVRDALGGYPFRAVDWKAQNKSLFQWMMLERLIIFLVISLITLVAAFNIISSLVMTIIEKRREIGILMSMGATINSITRIFMLNGTVVGFVGSTLGVGLGVLICSIQMRWALIPLPGDIYFIDTLPVLLRWSDVLAVYLSANVMCFLATLYPARVASSTPPAESLRFE